MMDFVIICIQGSLLLFMVNGQDTCLHSNDSLHCLTNKHMLSSFIRSEKSGCRHDCKVEYKHAAKECHQLKTGKNRQEYGACKEKARHARTACKDKCKHVHHKMDQVNEFVLLSTLSISDRRLHIGRFL